MDDWSDAEGNVMGLFGLEMEKLFYNKLNKTVPEDHRFYATKEALPLYSETLDRIHANGGEIVTVYGIGRPLRPAFSEPHYAADYETDEEGKKNIAKGGNIPIYA